MEVKQYVALKIEFNKLTLYGHVHGMEEENLVRSFYTKDGYAMNEIEKYDFSVIESLQIKIWYLPCLEEREKHPKMLPLIKEIPLSGILQRIIIKNASNLNYNLFTNFVALNST